MKLFAFTVVILSFQTAFAQTNVDYHLKFYPVFNKSNLVLNTEYYQINNNDSIQFETLKFYISEIEFLNNDKTVWKEKNSFHLLNATETKTLLIELNLKQKINFNQIKFNLGIDSATNVSGAMGGDLDPTNGMYWTWQSGYINFKLEGKSNLCKTRNNEFQFHLGGYLYQDYAMQTLMLNVSANEKTEILFDLDKLISEMDLSKQNQLMSPGKEAVLLSEKVAKCFSIKQP